jgi:mannose-1-phosphate guanylyltransferase
MVSRPAVGAAAPQTTLPGVEAVVLVGGLGTRMRPLSLSTPKQMLPTAGVPLLTHLLGRIRAAGVRHVVLSTSYRAEVFATHFGDGSALVWRWTTSSRTSRWALGVGSAMSRPC